jgi:RNA polymerase sigma-70 factor (ECF subfamily)
MPMRTQEDPGDQYDISASNSHQFFSSNDQTIKSPTNLSEQYLMSRITQGDEIAFWSLWERYRRYLYACCVQWLGSDRYEVDDALSRASIKAINGLLYNGHNIVNLRSWLIRVTRNICVDIIRERKKHRRSLYHLGELAKLGEWSYSYFPPLAEEALLKSEMSTAIRRAIEGLPCNLQLPSVMRFFQEMSYQDIAQKLYISPENVRKRIQQARAIIREKLNPYLSGAGEPLIETKEGKNQDENTCELPSEHSDVEDLESDTIMPCIAPYRLIRVKLRNGMEMEYYVPLKSMPKGVHQKTRTLQKYVQKHPRSWRKRLELADFLYITGAWPDAVTYYRQVLKRQAGFFKVWLQVGNTFHLMGEEGEAIVAFKHALELTQNNASRRYVIGLINS